MSTHHCNEVVLGSGAAALAAAAALPGCMVINLEHEPRSSVVVDQPLAEILKLDADETWRVESWIRDHDIPDARQWDSYPESLVSSYPFRKPAIKKLFSKAKGNTYQEANAVWGDAGSYLTEYNDKALGIWLQERRPEDLWMPPSRLDRFKQMFFPGIRKVATLKAEDFITMAAHELKNLEVSINQTERVQIVPFVDSEGKSGFSLLLGDGSESVVCDRIVNTLPYERFAYMIKRISSKALDAFVVADRLWSCVVRSPRGYVIVRSDVEVDQSEDRFLSKTMRALRVMHFGREHLVEIPLPALNSWQLPQEVEGIFFDLWEGEVHRLGAQGVFGKGTYTVEQSDRFFDPWGVMYPLPEHRSEWVEAIDEQQSMGIYHTAEEGGYYSFNVTPGVVFERVKGWAEGWKQG